MPDNVEHRQIVYLVLFDRPATAWRLAEVAGACQFVWNEKQRKTDRNDATKMVRALLAYAATRTMRT